MLVEARDDLLAFSALPLEHWRKLRSTNPLSVKGASQPRAAPAHRRGGRLPQPGRGDPPGAGAVLAEQHDEWPVARRYLSAESLARARLRFVEGDSDDQPGAEPLEVAASA